MRDKLEIYFRKILEHESIENKEESLVWRLSCYDSGMKLVKYIENNYFLLCGKIVLDVACGWGGHILAFAKQKAIVVACDINDHRFSKLQKFGMENNIELYAFQANCEKLPFEDETFDVLLGLELIEHIKNPEMFAQEVSRLLRPGGISIITTPSRWKSMYWGEPHYNLKWLTILPFFLQRFVATKIFKKKYPFPITRQYNFAQSIIKIFNKYGLLGYPVVDGYISKISKTSILNKISKQLFWSIIVLHKI